MSVLHRKLKRLKAVLRGFNQTQYVGISKRVDAKRKELDSIQMSVLSDPSPNLIELEKILTLELYDLMIAEESFSKQKSIVDWIHERDQNSQFFLENCRCAAKKKFNSESARRKWYTAYYICSNF